MACGAPSEEKKADKEVQAVCDEIRNQVQNREKTKFPKFEAVCYRTQLVAGTNYFIKVDVGNNSYIHLRVFKTLPHVGGYLELHAVKTGLTKEDSLEYFEK